MQTAAVVLTWVSIAAWMIVSLGHNIVPNLTHDLGQAAFTLTTVHAALGAVAAVVGTVVVVRAQQLQISGRSLRACRTPMQVSYGLYVAAVVLGIVVYVVTYG